jgi:hypothetical protein
MTTVNVAKSIRLSMTVNSLAARRRGQILPMLAIVVAVLFGLAGIVLDGGHMQFEKRHMQIAADAAAMGGAHELVAGETGQAIIDAARDDATLNEFQHYSAPDPQDPDPPPAPAMPITVEVNNPPLSGPKVGDAAYVEVIITKDYPTTFMRVIGIADAKVRARAVAGMENYGEGCVLALNPTEGRALEVNGTATLDSGCGVQVNSNDPSWAIRTTGGGIIDARPAGIASYGGADCLGCIPPATTGVPPTRDWLAHVPEPTVPNTVTTVYDVTDPNNPIPTQALGLGISGGTWNFHPGLYTGSTGNGNKKHGFDVSGGTINLYPGIYFLDSGFKVTSQTVFRTVGTNGLPGGPGEGVMFYNTTTADPTKAKSWNEIDFTGGGSTLLNPMTSGTYKGILFFEGRNSPKLNPGHRIAGNVGAELNGFLYFSKGHLDYSGTTAVGGWTGIIADTINVVGNATLSSNFIENSGNETPLRTALLVE